MKQRVTTALVGLVIFFAVLSLYHTIFLNIAALVVVFLALYEMFRVTGVAKHKPLALCCYLFGCMMPFTTTNHPLPILCGIAIFAFILFVILLIWHDRIDFSVAAVAFAATAAISTAVASIIWIRQLSSGRTEGIFYTLLAFGFAWITDTGASLFGITLGKHKLAPKLSPKKTVEGAIGGIVTCVLGTLLVAGIYRWVCGIFWKQYLDINYLRLVLIAPIGSVLSMIGDLSASLIKRQRGVKDYGSLMPGHGGIMDRFDSVFFTLPFIFLLMQLFPIFN